ncbi:hypothetical protein CMQ_3493 [Grosmannia clavigera kw1407]|uniref:Uncharacterized protein n=1 Tax=Grosmannia clavigera (strain kw1407 / UAMH 11150) TaxID=655863 RepID=F0XAH3_GROCL|nr:uncharacterized protein CMQ_3493 [Grosmannia clavigera kw1407]EFX05424.1 hypothetical protein CMQ_3493 [Grosmannia clavigera kw1407]
MPPRLMIRSGSVLGQARCSGGNVPFSLIGRPCAAARSFASSRDLATDKTASAASGSSSSDSEPPRIPPESPRYINVPTPPQSEEIRRPPQRGHLPIPRDIFHLKSSAAAKDGADGESQLKKSDAAAWTAAAAPRSQAEERGEPPRNEREAWRRRLADSRRESLEAGLSGLWERQQQRQQRGRARAENVANRNRRAALLKPDHQDDVLTRSSVREVTSKMTAVIRDPHRHERQAESAARTAAIAQFKREGRRDALMELYQAAGKFIVDEEELGRKVDELFRPDYFKEEGYSYGTVNAENIWDVVGKPSTVQDMMSGITRTETKLYDSKRTEVDRTTKRQKLVAEALTGGKMPV